MSKVTIAEAALLTGKARQTINKFTKRGDLSFSRNEEGAKVIDIAELQRVFPLVLSMDELAKARESGGEEEQAASVKPGTSEELAVLRVQLQGVERERDTLLAERERERCQLQEQIENLQNTLSNTQEQHSKAMLLLTDQSTGRPQAGGDQEKLNRELAETIKRLERRMQRLQADYEQEKKRGFFSRWLGAGTSEQRPATTQSAKA